MSMISTMPTHKPTSAQFNIYPSLISADPLHIEKSLQQLDPHCIGYHIDVMDGHFVPNITWGFDMVNAIAAATERNIWLHLMVTDPGKWLDQIDLREGSMVSFHIESNGEVSGLIAHIKEKKWRPSLAINPKTPVAETFQWLNAVDHVLLMSVEPGFSGQRFLPSTMAKLAELAEYRKKHNRSFIIGIDGGVGKSNVQQLVAGGAQDMAAASSLFETPNPVAALHELRALAESR